MSRARDLANLGDGITGADLPAGSVLQVVQATYSTEVSISSTSYTDTGLSATITPTSATSKILVVVNQQMYSDITANTILRVDAQIVRETTPVFEQTGCVGGRAGVGNTSDVLNYGSFNGVYLDSPSTTSATTYKTQVQTSTTGSGAQVVVSDSGSTSSITLMEIAG